MLLERLDQVGLVEGVLVVDSTLQHRLPVVLRRRTLRQSNVAVEDYLTHALSVNTV